MNSVNSCIENTTEDRIGTGNEYFEIEIPFHLYQYLGSDGCNIQNLCRICLSTDNEVMFPLLSTKDNSLLADMFTAFTAIKLFAGDGLPANICTSCQAQVVHCYEFKSQCEKSNCTLQSILKGGFISKVEPIDNNVSLVVAPESQNVEEIKIKEEADLCDSTYHLKPEKSMDIEYLEDLSDISNENEALCIMPVDTVKRKKKKITISVTDSKSLLSEVVSEKLGTKKKERSSYGCTFCTKKFFKVKALNTHIKNTHRESQQPYSCDQCKESFSSEHDLMLHSVLHSKGTTWQCNKCQKEFNSKAVLRRHIQRHMETKRYACEACGKPFAERYALRRHARVHTGEALDKKHECHLCDKRYSESGLLAAHVARHAGARPCVCAACGKAFPSPRLLASHALVHTDDKPYQCRYCDKRFRHESTRNTHHRTHTGEKPYVCSACGKTFIQNSNLTLHMRTHTGEKPYTCATCNRKFSSSSTLKAHARTHTGERPYECEVCGKRFARLNMRAHMRLHSDDRPYECSMCPKKFVNATRLRDHARVHTGEKPFECATCSQKFPTKSHLVRHVKSHQAAKNSGKRIIVCGPEFMVANKIVFSDANGNSGISEEVVAPDTECKTNILLDSEVPLEVGGELVLQDDSNIKAEMLVVDNSQSYQSENVDLNATGVIVSDINYANNLVALNEGEASISTSSAVLEGTTVKLYQLDQSLLQIHTSGGQLTISKITSKMTANF